MKGASRKRSTGPSAWDPSDVGPLATPTKIRDPEVKSRLHRVANEMGEDFHFQDEEDEFEDEEWVDERSTDEEGAEMKGDDNDVPMEDEDEEMMEEKQAWLRGDDEEAVELEYDPRTYHMLHPFELNWPCLSFDVLPDSYGQNRQTYPHTVYLIAGTQPEDAKQSQVFVVKLSGMYKTNKDSHNEDSSDDEQLMEEDDQEDKEYSESSPDLIYKAFYHDGGVVNRIRSCPQLPRLVATWSASSNVNIWDIQCHLDRLDSFVGPAPPSRLQPKFVVDHHTSEGFALDWNPHTTGQLLTGGADKRIYQVHPVEGGWVCDAEPFTGHSDSVEDIHWKRLGGGIGVVFASCSVDKSIRLFDSRASKASVSQILTAHSSDVNVISWSPITQDLLLSGGEDGVCKVWDVRRIGTPLCTTAQINWHRKPISSVDWHPVDSAVFATASLDDSVAFWDMSVEPEDVEVAVQKKASNVPDQLMFLHMGQHHVSEIHWHPQIPGLMISTAESGFNIYKSENM